MAQKTCYVKCVSNEQAQQLRGELVGVGFVDDEWWNDARDEQRADVIKIWGDMVINVFDEVTGKKFSPELYYTLTPDENLTEAAVKIKELFDNQ